MAAFELVLRRPNRSKQVCYGNHDDAEVGDVVMVDGIPWLVVETQPPFKLRRIERIICVPRSMPRY